MPDSRTAGEEVCRRVLQAIQSELRRGNPCPTGERLAQVAGVERSSAYRALRTLEAAGKIRRYRIEVVETA
jgi:DNA-binding GntR family transcriptional regulator